MKVTWLDLYSFLYNKAHDLNNLGDFDWSAEIKVVDPETSKEYIFDPARKKKIDAVDSAAKAYLQSIFNNQ